MKRLLIFALIVFVPVMAWSVGSPLPHIAQQILAQYTTLKTNDMVKVYKVNSAYAVLVKTYNSQTGELEPKVHAVDATNIAEFRDNLISIAAQCESLLADLEEAETKNDLADGYIPPAWE